MKRISSRLIVLTLCLAAAPCGLVHGQTEVGVVEFSNSGATEAQQPFLYGLAQLHNFEYEDAAAALEVLSDTSTRS